MASEAAAAAEAEKPRERVEGGRYSGLVIEWKGYMGWIHPLVPIKHEKATKHQGRIYLNQNDISKEAANGRVKEGKIVDFYVYVDDDGLGAEECRTRTVLRLTLPHSEANKLKSGGQWSDYLSDSQYYPSFEAEHGCILRKYSWTMPFALLELWGQPEELAKGAVALVDKKGDDDKDECYMRLLLPESQISKVEKLPSNPKVSNHVVISDPVACRSVTFNGTREKCQEAVKAFLTVMGKPGPGGA
eukprot:gnl/TRDRNA2_/TRDRNA2_197360_c0_seq1.p1 gnl/TRDRNA2_/TRDRNA2_197360_c0~~gnl/TRDRNA2_/TRDRNA2_197360_c0_seq1.p1  ORF type:complete len:245 (+),score=52.63 gnl/TRDRNA2_/TRDRNA2_197360_c0_seq1:61-795(+)